MTTQPHPQPTPPGGTFDGPLHLYAVRVYYEDTDLSGIVYHANYLRWFERARSDVLRMLEIDQRAAIEAGVGAYAVADLQLKYVRPAKLDDDVVIHTRCTQLKAASVIMHQRAIRGSELLCEATFRVGFVAPDGRPRRQPEAWRDAFAPIISQAPTASKESSS
ncbi:YbgC/FadM family acyl-CoA thioesterase [Pontixanthobacter aestiaquae]|uniref:YbgC/FadM family acyl-CoA thioesterase n=1 Tax=Pontixanthobacter aestiaquae TaxID=1509367 RepID=A0A844Z613_9SPHN|nr:YbgC/FadM family acyl-CoA thioesterase [Pontixanthobacter aestiaquae]MDN3646313.1 YbgC/FadM family acyl-CoA thioesterase [Pontixanthobacter aestiaquae]MXO82696.1 YbgC/FadM family acyl-CoA thioesterase [Pontixanthobacter aestiaquae]